MNKIYLIGGIALTVSIAAIGILSNRLKAVTEERDIQRKNVETLFTDVEGYEVRDSLKAATIADLQLTLSQYKRFREEDAELISDVLGEFRDRERQQLAAPSVSACSHRSLHRRKRRSRGKRINRERARQDRVQLEAQRRAVHPARGGTGRLPGHRYAAHGRPGQHNRVWPRRKRAAGHTPR